MFGHMCFHWEHVASGMFQTCGCTYPCQVLCNVSQLLWSVSVHIVDSLSTAPLHIHHLQPLSAALPHLRCRSIQRSHGAACHHCQEHCLGDSTMRHLSLMDPLIDSIGRHIAIVRNSAFGDPTMQQCRIDSMRLHASAVRNPALCHDHCEAISLQCNVLRFGDAYCSCRQSP